MNQIVNPQHSLDKLLELQQEIKTHIEQKVAELVANNDLAKRVKVPGGIPIKVRYVLSIPFIYGIAVPAIIWHLGLEIYHQVCFRLYGIPLVKAGDYFIYDRQLLSWLNWWEKIHCIYCSYVNNLIRYSAEIGGRTERYWCPIKYYRRLNHAHSQYAKFVEGKSIKQLRKHWEELRDFSDLAPKK